MSELLVNTIKKADGTGSLSVPAESGTVVTTASPSLGRRNLIINGAMQVAQRGTSTSITAQGTYFSPDRFEIGVTATDQLAATLSQSTVSPDEFGNSLKFDVTTAETTLDADEIVTVRQKFEGQNLQGIAKGTSSAKQVTLSFWVRSGTTGTYICELYDNDNTRQISKSYTIDTADTWEQKVITFPADTTGALDNDNNLSLWCFWWLAAGSNYTSGTLNDSAWASATTANRVVGQTNLIATTSDFYLTGVQLEVGSVASSYEHRSYGEELALCQRYYQKFVTPFNMFAAHQTNQVYGVRPLFQEMRATPTSTNSAESTFTIIGNNEAASPSGGLDGVNTASNSSVEIYANGTFTLGRAYFMRGNGSAYIDYDAEL